MERSSTWFSGQIAPWEKTKEKLWQLSVTPLLRFYGSILLLILVCVSISCSLLECRAGALSMKQCVPSLLKQDLVQVK